MRELVMSWEERIFSLVAKSLGMQDTSEWGMEIYTI